MNRILAIEPDRDRGRLLRQLLCDSLEADLVFATSTDMAIAAMSEQQPDLVLTSMLLSTNEEQDLLAHLRATPSVRHLPVLTIPAMADASARETRPFGLLAKLLRRREPEPRLAFNANAVITRIEDALEQSKIAAARAAEGNNEHVEPIAENLAPPGLDLGLVSRVMQKRSRRLAPSELPWLSSMKLSWGQHLRVLNISRSGVLIESGVRLFTGSATTFHIQGPEPMLAVPARIVRCRVSEVDSLGVKYETAAAFDRPIDALTAAEPKPSDIDSCLDNVLEQVERRASSGASHEELRSTFEGGILDLIAAGEVRLRDVPVVEDDGRESVIFSVPTRDGSPAVLQVTFNPDDAPGAEDFEMLSAAAGAAFFALPLTGTARQTTLRLPGFTFNLTSPRHLVPHAPASALE
jgi:CheY-like chemotaxis protein